MFAGAVTTWILGARDTASERSDGPGAAQRVPPIDAATSVNNDVMRLG
jgi:hypothetical protein